MRVGLTWGELEASWVREPADPARVVVLLHEGLGSSTQWRDFPQRIADALPGTGVLVYDRYGYGRSDRGVGFRPDFMHHEAQQVLPALLAALSIERPLLVGHSDGGSIALLAAGQRTPAGVASLAAHVVVEPETLDGIRAAKQSFAAGGLRQALARHHDDVDAVFHGWSQTWLDPDFAAWDITSEVETSTCPAVVIQGLNDPYGTRRQAELAIAALGDGAVEVLLPGVGHAPHLEAPGESVDAVVALAGRCWG